MFDFGVHKMISDVRHDGKKTAVCYGGDFLDFLMMVLDESQMGHQRRKVLPAWKQLGGNQQAIQFALRFDVGIHFSGQGLKIRLFEWALRFDDENSPVTLKFVGNHRFYLHCV